MKSLIRQITPPAVKKLVRRFRNNGTELPRFASYADALAWCSKGAYEHTRLIEAIHWSTKQVRDKLAASVLLDVDDKGAKNLMMLERGVRNGELHVIDFGGACGMHYFSARAYFGDRVRLRWHVVETPAMVKQCADLRSEELQFHETVEAACAVCPEADIMFTSGTTMYTPDPLEYTRRLVEGNARILYITRQGLLDDNRTVITAQERKISKGVSPMPPGMEDSILSYPVTWASRTKFEEVIQERYTIELRIREGEMLFRLDGADHYSYGYLGRRK